MSFVPEIALARGPRFDRVQTTPVPHDPKRALFKLGLVLQSDDKDLYLTFDFSTALWAPRTIERMAQHLVTLLTRGLAEPDVPLRSFAMLTDHEIEELRSVDGRRDIPHRHRTLHLGFEAQVDAAPKAEAVRSNGSGLTYAELDAAANQLARLLMSNGVVRGDKVALLLERTHLIPIAVLTIVKTSAAYVPIDASWPASRAELVLADSAPSAILTESSLRHVVAGYDTTILELDSMEISDQPTQRVQVEVDSEDVAYVIYTSGSTGRPKGVEGCRGNPSQRDASVQCDRGTIHLHQQRPLVDVSLHRVRLLGLGTLGGIASRRVRGGGSLSGDPKPGRIPRVAHRRADHRPQPNALSISDFARRGRQHQRRTLLALRDLRRGEPEFC